MKYRCACGKPKRMTIQTARFPGDSHNAWISGPIDDDTLHFKAADRECERCGRPLCSKCAVDSKYGHWEKYSIGPKNWIRLVNEYLCPICSEVI